MGADHREFSVTCAKSGEPGMSFSPAEMLVEMVRDMQIGGWPAAEEIYVYALCWVFVTSSQAGREIIILLY